jgi:hypothetical protein
MSHQFLIEILLIPGENTNINMIILGVGWKKALLRSLGTHRCGSPEPEGKELLITHLNQRQGAKKHSPDLHFIVGFRFIVRVIFVL